jgi:hypothetical protein
MTLAEKIASGKEKPTAAVAKAMEQVEAASRRVYEAIEEALLSNGYAALFMANGADSFQDAKTKAKEKAADDKENGTYAYAFVGLDDGSALAVYTVRVGEPVQMRAFESLAHTRQWHPTRQVSAFAEQE